MGQCPHAGVTPGRVAEGLAVPHVRVPGRSIERVRLALGAQAGKGIVRKVVDWPDA